MDNIRDRPLTVEEVLDLANQLDKVNEQTGQTYCYPIADLIAWMREHPDSLKHRGQLEGGKMRKVFLHFKSPAYTWKMLCGREGVYTVDPKTLCAEAYDFICMN